MRPLVLRSSNKLFTTQNSFAPRIDMTTYVYESIDQKADKKPHYFEIKQSMNDAPLTKHPETGELIRRVVLGGFGTLSSKPSKSSSGSSCGCAPGECCA
jgi:predicted nucleic acid-binding Zn ribbon protein